ncbi:MAG: sulfatase [Myxococcota bacterium]
MLLALLACAGPPEGARSIVWISLDTVRADRLAVYGGPAATPTLAKLAGESLVFEQAYSHFPETGLSHWSMLTGVLPEVHGNVPEKGDSAYTGPTAAEIAKANGYATAAFVGGVTLKSQSTGLQRGFDRYDDSFQFDPRDMKRDGDEVTRLAAAWIAEQEAPYLAFVHYFDAHFPYTPDRADDPGYGGTLDGSDAALRPYRDGKAIDPRDLEHVKKLYDAELTELDATLAPLLATLKGDEVVVVTADHGESFEHGYLFNHRGSLADGNLHVPLVVRVPGVAPARRAEQVGLIDLLPTVLEAAGLESDAPFQGKSVLAGGGRDVVWSRTDPWMAGRCYIDPGPLLAMRTPTRKVVWTGDGGARAFDLAADPGETTAIHAEETHADYDALVAAMKAHTRALTPRGPPPPGQMEQLEALGYVQPGPPGPPPQGPPPGPGEAPIGPPGPPPQGGGGAP